MATPLIPALDTSLTRQAMAFQADLFQNLGNQIRKDITTVVTNRQMQGLAEGLQSVDTTSPQFGRQVAGLFAQYPLAAQSPLGQAAINQLGSEFKLNQQIAAEDRRFDNQLGIYAAKRYADDAPIGQPVTVDNLRRVARNQPPLPTNRVGINAVEPPLSTRDGLDMSDTLGPQESPVEIIPGIPNPNASIVEPTAQQAAPAQSRFMQQREAYYNDLVAKGVGEREANQRLKLYDVELRAQIAAENRDPRILSTDQGFQTFNPRTRAVEPIVKDGNPVRQRSSQMSPSRALASEASANERLIKDYEKEIEALRMGTGVQPKPGGGYRAWKRTQKAPSGEWVDVPAKEGERWLLVNDQLSKLREQVKQQRSRLADMALTEVDTPAAAAQTAAQSPTQLATPAPSAGIVAPPAGNKWKVDPKTGIKWEVGPDGQLTGTHVKPN